MKFAKIINKIIPAKNENPLSRLYGYARNQNGKMQIVPNEAYVISTVITALATRKTESVDEIINNILQEFFIDGVRNRSGKNWTRQSLLGLVRPVYGGVVVSKMGVWRKSRIYPLIVEPSQVKAALKRLKTVKADIDSPRKVSHPRMAGA
ncbi:MAG: hypothetical protein JZU49_01280 [Sulfuricurvum sp.]|nr:hypothetical protein [Sulfuricurvum sp.]